MRISLVLPLLFTFLATPATSLEGIDISPPPSLNSAPESSPWRFPIPGVRASDVIRGFELPDTHSHGGRGHRGLDFSVGPGTAIHSVGAGVVFFVGVIAGKPTVSINHGVHARFGPLPIRSTYEPVASTLSRGDYVHGGQKIGYTALGNSHCRAKCLHLGLKVDKDRYINPILLWSHPSSLLSSARG